VANDPGEVRTDATGVGRHTQLEVANRTRRLMDIEMDDLVQVRPCQRCSPSLAALPRLSAGAVS
jgi:hypothetical protein